mgnify:CR=1 FL=1
MKDIYPSYRETGTKHIYLGLSLTDKKILDRFLLECSTTANPHKVDDYKRNLLQARDIIEKDFDKWDKDDIVSFLSLANQASKTMWSRKGITIILKKFIKFQYKDLELLELITDVNKKNKKRLNPQRVNKSKLLELDELEKMIRSSEKLRDKALILTLYESAARPEELRNLTWSRIKFGADVSEITLVSNKTGDHRTVFVQKATLHLRRWKEEYCFPNVKESDFVFPTTQNRTKPMSDVLFGYIIKTIAKKADIKKNIYPYIFRHSRLTELVEKQVPEQQIKKFAGHTPDSRMMKTYIHLSTQNLEKVLLEKVYNIEDIPEEQKNKLEKEVERMQEIIKRMEQRLKVAESKEITISFEGESYSPEEFKHKFKDRFKEVIKK